MRAASRRSRYAVQHYINCLSNEDRKHSFLTHVSLWDEKDDAGETNASEDGQNPEHPTEVSARHLNGA